MRVIDTGFGEVLAVAVAPDGWFVAASSVNGFGWFEWATGERVPGTPGAGGARQIAFGPAGNWAARVPGVRLHLHGTGVPFTPLADRSVTFTGGVAVSPDGKFLAATATTGSGQPRLELWALPAVKPVTGFEYWFPCRRLAFSPNGQFLAGIWNGSFELRFAASGGLDYRTPAPADPRNGPPGFVTFDRDSDTCAFGWEHEFHLIDISTGTSKRGATVRAPFRDATFSPGADLFATVGNDGRLRFWNPQTWTVTREYDWQCGPLTCLAFTADGAAGVCGTADGRLVQFDVD